MYIYKVIAKSSVAHKLEHYKGKCSNLHGHTIKVMVEIGFQEISSPTNMKLDFKEIKKMMEKIVPDHVYLNEYYNCTDPTAEVLARKIYEEFVEVLAERLSLHVEGVTVWESEKAGVFYSN